MRDLVPNMTDHEATRRSFRLEVPERFNYARNVVDARAVASPDALAVGLQQHVKRLTAPYKYPREIEFVTDLPRTVGGKVRRVELREGEQTSRRTEGGTVVAT